MVATRWGLATPMARTLLPARNGYTVALSIHIAGTWPPITSWMAGAAPRYGSCVSLSPLCSRNSSPTRWCGLPGPADAQFTPSGMPLAQAMNSLRFLAGTLLDTTKNIGKRTNRPTGWKSFSALSLSVLNKNGLAASVAKSAENIRLP